MSLPEYKATCQGENLVGSTIKMVDKRSQVVISKINRIDYRKKRKEVKTFSKIDNTTAFSKLSPIFLNSSILDV